MPGSLCLQHRKRWKFSYQSFQNENVTKARTKRNNINNTIITYISSESCVMLCLLVSCILLCFSRIFSTHIFLRPKNRLQLKKKRPKTVSNDRNVLPFKIHRPVIVHEANYFIFFPSFCSLPIFLCCSSLASYNLCKIRFDKSSKVSYNFALHFIMFFMLFSFFSFSSSIERKIEAENVTESFNIFSILCALHSRTRRLKFMENTRANRQTMRDSLIVQNWICCIKQRGNVLDPIRVTPRGQNFLIAEKKRQQSEERRNEIPFFDMVWLILSTWIHTWAASARQSHWCLSLGSLALQ